MILPFVVFIHFLNNSNTSFQYIQNLLHSYAPPGILLPLCIMTSIDTNDKTIQLLKDNNYFGMEPSQVTVVQQGMGVPALMDNDAKIATVEVENNGRDVLLKPHGHGE